MSIKLLSSPTSSLKPARLLPWLALTLSAGFAGPASAGEIQFVSPRWAAQNAAGWHVLDVRQAPLEYVAGHLPGAVNVADSSFRGPDGFLPVQYWSNADLERIFSLSGVKNGQKVLVYSDGRDILGATAVAYLLERFGVQEVAVLDGGYTGYAAAGEPVTKEYKRYSPGQFSIKDDPAVRVTLQELRGLIGKPGVVVVDPRPGELFRGEKNLWVRNGHIPGARNIPWPTFTQADNPEESSRNAHKLKSLDEIRALLVAKNVKPTDDIIVSCSTGREATLQYIVLKHLLKFPRVRVYEGSWTEYATTDLPVETGPEKP